MIICGRRNTSDDQQAHPSDDVLFIQVGNGEIDNGYWFVFRPSLWITLTSGEETKIYPLRDRLIQSTQVPQVQTHGHPRRPLLRWALCCIPARLIIPPRPRVLLQARPSQTRHIPLHFSPTHKRFTEWLMRLHHIRRLRLPCLPLLELMDLQGGVT